MRTCKKCGFKGDGKHFYRRPNGKWNLWCRKCSNERGMTDKQGLKSVVVDCRGCGHGVQVMLDDGDKVPPVYCEACKSRESWHNNPVADEAALLSQVLSYFPVHGEVRILRPGMVEFHEAASQCTPISRVRTVGTISAPGEASVSRLWV